ncbi:hypothetical protein [Nitratireductor indicus]|uniref:hypothetical protein n=1 Tax=Nitratireductor indicus TaxID=721133 RepID=UPI0028771BF8|nr:hypothetical protein [Nitratireductor indicus]MDS1135999.1 hypothetical protein [Nitratireductor indicus]
MWDKNACQKTQPLAATQSIDSNLEGMFCSLTRLLQEQSNKDLFFTLSVEGCVITVTANLRGVGRKGAYLRRVVRYSSNRPVAQIALLPPQRYIVSIFREHAEYTGFETVSDSDSEGIALQASLRLIEEFVANRNMHTSSAKTANTLKFTA